MDPTTLSFTDANALIERPTPLDAAAFEFLENENYWQRGSQYVGPKPALNDAAGMEYLESSFVAFPKLGELTRRHTEGVVGREPAFEVVIGTDTEGKPSDSPLKKEIDEGMGEWWDNEKMHELAQVFTSHLSAVSRAYYHYSVAPGLVEEATDANGDVATVVDAEDWKDALTMIAPEVVSPSSATIYIDPATREKLALYRYVESSGTYEVVSKRPIYRNCIEMSWLQTRDESGERIQNPLTVVRIVRDDDSAPEEMTIDTGGVLLLVQGKQHPLVFQPFITPANVRLNNALNSTATMVKVNCDVAGFPEQKHIDIQQPEDEDGNPTELETGPRTAPFMYSHADDAVGVDGEKYLRPRSGTIIFRQPVSSEPLREDAEFFKRALYENARQAHVLNDISSNASGIARVEARAEFANSLLKTKPIVEGALRDLLRGVRMLAAYLAQDPRIEQFREARESVTCHASSGPLSPDEARLVIEMSSANPPLISAETAMVMLGREDVDAEQAKIKEEKKLRQEGEGDVNGF